MTTSTNFKTYDHPAEAAARSEALAAAKVDLIRARQERDDAELETEGSPADVTAWRNARDRFDFAVESVTRAERAVRAAERRLLNLDTKLAEAMSVVLQDAFYGRPISVQPHRHLDIPAKLDAPLVTFAQLEPGVEYGQVGTLSGTVRVAYVASQPWARVPSTEELEIAGRTLTAAPVYTVRYSGPVSEAPTGWPSAWFEVIVSAVADPAFIGDDDHDGSDQEAAEAAPAFAAL